MISITHKIIADIPLLEVVDEEISDKELPTVVFYHGWTNVKESVLVNGYELAKRGMRAILPEALYHGERKDEKETEEHYLDFWKIVETNILEFPKIKKYYEEHRLSLSNFWGATGLSMGGITTCGLAASYESIYSFVCLMGSPYYCEFAREIVKKARGMQFFLPEDVEAQIRHLESFDLSLSPQKINERPFHFWHGKADETVPYGPTFAFYEKYHKKKYGKNMSFTTTAGGHKVPYDISVEMAEFFRQHLCVKV